jgi:hypothetical protein
MVVRRIFGPNRDELAGIWKDYTICTLLQLIVVITSMRMRLVSNMEEVRT